MTATGVAPSSTTVSYDDFTPWHVVCECDPEVAMCGTALEPGSEADGIPDGDHACHVCADLEPLPCPRCGE